MHVLRTPNSPDSASPSLDAIGAEFEFARAVGVRTTGARGAAGAPEEGMLPRGNGSSCSMVSSNGVDMLIFDSRASES